ncbi:MAG: hypothetical protein ACOXZK_05070 [Bacteroidales bacterium]
MKNIITILLLFFSFLYCSFGKIVLKKDSDKTTNALDTSAMFEETKHLHDGVIGEQFDIKNNFKGFGIEHEVSAKKWVVDNIKGIKGRYKNGDYKESTHYGFFKRNPSKLTTTNLEKGIDGLHAPNIDSRKPGRIYRLYGTGGY